MTESYSEYSEKFHVRQFEKSVLEDAFAEACEPGDHNDDCPPNNARCPYR